MTAKARVAWDCVSSDTDDGEHATFRLPESLRRALPFSLDSPTMGVVESPVTRTEPAPAHRLHSDLGLAVPRVHMTSHANAGPARRPQNPNTAALGPAPTPVRHSSEGRARRHRISRNRLPSPSSSEEEAAEVSATRVPTPQARQEPRPRSTIAPSRADGPPPSTKPTGPAERKKDARLITKASIMRSAGHGGASKDELTDLLREAAGVIETLEAQVGQLRSEADALRDENVRLQGECYTQGELRVAVDAALAQNQILRERNGRLKARLASVSDMERVVYELQAENAMAVDVIARQRLELEDAASRTGRADATSLAWTPGLTTRIQRSFGTAQAPPGRVEVCIAEKIRALQEHGDDRMRSGRGGKTGGRGPVFTFDKVDATTYVVRELGRRLQLTATGAGVVLVRSGGGAVDIDTYLEGLARKQRREGRVKKSSRKKANRSASAPKKKQVKAAAVVAGSGDVPHSPPTQLSATVDAFLVSPEACIASPAPASSDGVQCDTFMLRPAAGSSGSPGDVMPM